MTAGTRSCQGARDTSRGCPVEEHDGARHGQYIATQCLKTHGVECRDQVINRSREVIRVRQHRHRLRESSPDCTVKRVWPQFMPMTLEEERQCLCGDRFAVDQQTVHIEYESGDRRIPSVLAS